MAVAQRTPLSQPWGRLSKSSGRIAIALVTCTVLLTWSLTAVPILDIARYVAFEALFVLLPGCMLYKLLSRESAEWLRMLAIGWPLGYAIEIGAFALTAALGQRELFSFLPLFATLALGPALLYARGRPDITGLRRRFRGRDISIDGEGEGEDRGFPLLVMGCVVCAAVVVLLVEWFSRYPLPEHTTSVAYFPDNVFDISIAADAVHHWPIMAPYVAGQPLRYYTGFFIHAAAINQVTGVSLAIVVLRLFPVTMTLLIGLQLWVLGSKLGHSRWTGTLAAALFFLVNDLSLDATNFQAFGVTPFDQLTVSPTYALGIPFMLGLLALIQRRLAITDEPDRSQRPRSAQAGAFGSLLMVGVLVLGGTAVKTFAIADFIGGLGLFCLWRLVVAKDRSLLAYLALSTLCVGVIYRLMLSGGVSPFRIHPLDFMHFTILESLYPAHTVFQLGVLVGASLLTCFFLFVPALGALWLLRNRAQNGQFVLFSALVFAVSLAAYTILEDAGDAQLAFMDYGSIAIMPVAALGLMRLWEQTPHIMRAKILRACLFMLGLGLALSVSTRLLIRTAVYFGWKNIDYVSWVWILWYVAAYGLVACATIFFGLKFERYYAPAIRSRAVRIAGCAIPLLLTLGLVKSLGLALPEVWDTLLDRQWAMDSSDNRGMTAALYRGLLWVRAHTTTCDILAVNNHSTSAREVDSIYFYYSAFSERRVFLESWSYTPGGTYNRQPFPARYALNNRAVILGEPRALRELASMGVGYVLIDKLHGTGAREPADVSRLVFSNSALDVYRLAAPAASRRKAACASTGFGL
jgi:hypothetical protein